MFLCRFLLILIALPVQMMAQQPRLIIPIGHTNRVNTANYSPSGKFIVTASDDGSAKIWDVVEGKLLMELKTDDGKVYSARYSDDEKYIITHSSYMPYDSVRIWHAYSGKLLYTGEPSDCKVELYADTVKTCLFESSGDGKYYLTYERQYGRGNAIVIWDATNSTKKFTATIGENTIQSAVFSPDSRYFATHDNYTLRIWNLKTGKVINKFLYRVYANKIRLHYLPDGKHILMHCETYLDVYNLDSGKIVSTIIPSMIGRDELFTGINSVSSSPLHKNILIAEYGGARVVNPFTRKTVMELTGKTDMVKQVAFHPSGDILAVILRNRNTSTWNIREGKMISDFGVSQLYRKKGHTLKNVFRRASLAFKYAASFDPSGQTLATIYDEDILYTWDLAKGKPSVLMKADAMLNSVSYSPDGKYVLITGDGNVAVIRDVKTGNDIGRLDSKFRYNYAEFSKDGRRILTTLNDNDIILWDAATFSKTAELKGHKKEVAKAVFSSNGRYIVSVSFEDRSVITWDSSGAKISQQKAASRVLAIDPSSSFFITANDKNLHLSSLPDGKFIRAFEGHTGKITCTGFSNDGNLVFSGSEDNTVKCWNTSTGKLVYTFFSLDSMNYLTVMPDGYYRSSQNAAKRLYYVTDDLQMITFDQLDIKYNRPDKILLATAISDKALIEAYHKAYLKRIKKLNIDTSAFTSEYNLPIADIINANEISKEQVSGKLNLNIGASDKNSRLDRLNVWVNGVPVFGASGIPLRRRKISLLDTFILIRLCDGKNVIETSVINTNGIESYRKSITVNYSPVEPAVQKVYFVGIGIDQYKDVRYNLDFSVKDIKDLAVVFKGKYGEKLSIDTLLNKNVTRQKVMALKQKLSALGENDIVILAFSGHGILSKDFDYYLSTYAIDFEKPERDGLSYEDMETLLDNTKARKKLMLIDACHSGEVDKEELSRIEAAKAEFQKTGVNTKGLSVKIKQKEGLGLKNSFELMQSLFVNVSRGIGANIISAAAGTQFALERKDLANGVFTFALLELMRSKDHLSISALKEYVSFRVTELTSGLQKPTFRSEASGYDWQLW